jgi:methyl-accepting chemotaxis protein
MNFSKPFGPSSADTSAVEIEGNIRELARAGAVVRQTGNGDGEIGMTGLGHLLHRVSDNSGREIDTLISQLQRLRDKLETDSERLQHDISEYASLSQQVMQVAKIISESVHKFPDVQKPSA